MLRTPQIAWMLATASFDSKCIDMQQRGELLSEAGRVKGWEGVEKKG